MARFAILQLSPSAQIVLLFIDHKSTQVFASVETSYREETHLRRFSTTIDSPVPQTSLSSLNGFILYNPPMAM
jgi:hypothetical protein